MIVSELIEELKKYPLDSYVDLEYHDSYWRMSFYAEIDGIKKLEFNEYNIIKLYNRANMKEELAELEKGENDESI